MVILVVVLVNYTDLIYLVVVLVNFRFDNTCISMSKLRTDFIYVHTLFWLLNNSVMGPSEPVSEPAYILAI